MEEEFKVSRDLMRAVSADTRTQILHALESRQMTASELSRHLDKHVTTVAEHLELLHQSNLVERIERPGRKWIYYRLSRIGKQMLHPQPYKVILVLALSFVTLSFGLLSIPIGFRGDLLSTFEQQTSAAPLKGSESLPAAVSDQSAVSPGGAQASLTIAVVLVIFAVGGVAYSLVKIRKDYIAFRVPE